MFQNIAQNVKKRKLFRDGLEEEIIGLIKVHETSDGHVVESYRLASGKKRRYFVTIAGTDFCAHGDTVAQAIADALWKDPKKRPSMESLRDSLKNKRDHKFTLNEFRLLTGACLVGCRLALARAKKDETPMTANEIRKTVSREWGDKLISVLGWQEVKS